MTKCGILSGAVIAGAVLRMHAVCVWENIFNIAGVAVGHATTSVSK